MRSFIELVSVNGCTYAELKARPKEDVVGKRCNAPVVDLGLKKYQ